MEGCESPPGLASGFADGLGTVLGVFSCVCLSWLSDVVGLVFSGTSGFGTGAFVVTFGGALVGVILARASACFGGSRVEAFEVSVVVGLVASILQALSKETPRGGTWNESTRTGGA